MSNERNSTNFLRVVAIALVVNSHMDLFYPAKFGFLATGGMLGNALFFMLSSYGLLLSMQTSKRSFAEWYERRISRIFPATWVIVVMLTLPIGIYEGTVHLGNLLDQMDRFFYPPFWFLQALLIYYIFVFFIVRDYTPRRLAYVAGAVLALYLSYYIFLLDLTQFSIEGTPFRLIFYFLVILWGIFLGSHSATIRYRGFSDVLLLCLSVACIYGHKFLMQRGVGAPFQCIQHLATFPALYYFIKIAKSDFIRNMLMGEHFIGRTFTFFSALTLELFMVNNSIDFLGPKLGSFPGNVIGLMALNIGLALLVHFCAKPVGRIFGAGARVTASNHAR